MPSGTNFTDAEWRDIATLMFEGRSNAYICEKLGVSERTLYDRMQRAEKVAHSCRVLCDIATGIPCPRDGYVEAAAALIAPLSSPPA